MRALHPQSFRQRSVSPPHVRKILRDLRHFSYVGFRLDPPHIHLRRRRHFHAPHFHHCSIIRRGITRRNSDDRFSLSTFLPLLGILLSFPSTRFSCPFILRANDVAVDRYIRSLEGLADFHLPVQPHVRHSGGCRIWRTMLHGCHRSFGCLVIIVSLNLDKAGGLILSKLRGFGVEGNSVDHNDIRSLSCRNNICHSRRDRLLLEESLHTATSDCERNDLTCHGIHNLPIHAKTNYSCPLSSPIVLAIASGMPLLVAEIT